MLIVDLMSAIPPKRCTAEYSLINQTMDEDTIEEAELLEVKSDSSSRPTSRNSQARLSLSTKLTLACAPNLSDELLQAVLQNDHANIDAILDRSTADILHHRYGHHDRKTILVIACLDSRVTGKTLRTLYQSVKKKYGDLDFTDAEWFGWEPIHYAAKAADPEKLEALVEQMEDVNNLTTFSENALHILLSRAVRPFQIVLCNGVESRPFSIIGRERNDVVECVRILLNGGIDLNHTNFWNEAPICLAARYRFQTVIELLLKNPYIDIDSNQESGKNIAEYLKRNNIWLNSLSDIQNFYHNDRVKQLFDYLKTEDEDSFLNFNNGNIRDFANEYDDSGGRGTCGTMLQFCFKKGFMEYLHSEAYAEKLTKHSMQDTPMLKVFLAKGMAKCILHLLDNGADPNITDNKCREPILEAAAVRGYYPLVALLLERKDTNVEEVYTILPNMFDQPCSLKNNRVYRNYVIYLLLNKLMEVHGNERLTGKKLRILNKVLCRLNLEMDENQPDESEIICQILSLGASLMYRDPHTGKTIIDRLNSSILRLHFDECIEHQNYCYNSLIEDIDNDYSETKALRFLLRDKAKKELLIHPLISHFIHNKWLRIAWFFYTDLVFYTAYLLTIWAYMVCLNDGIVILPLHCLLYILLGFHIVKEAIQLVILYHFKYFSDFSNYTEVLIIGLCLITVCNQNIYTMVLTIIISTIVFFLMLGQLPIFTKYTIILGSTKYFLQYVGFYFFQFVSFAICFYMVFPFEQVEGQTPTMLGDLFKSLFYSMIIFTGEFNERVLNPTQYPVFGRVLTTLFCFCMTIILNNLLVGLIVSDINEIQDEAKFKKQVKAAEFVVRTNSLVKRLSKLRSLDVIKKVINHIHLFRKGMEKMIDRRECHHAHAMDDEDTKYLKELKARRHLIFDENALWSLWKYIEKYLRDQSRFKY